MKVLVFDIGGTAIKYGLCDNGVMINNDKTPTEASKGGEHIVELLLEIAGRYNGFDAIGISTAGQVDAGSGSIKYANSNIPGYTGTKLREILENRFGVPVYVENDVNSAAMGEAIFGAGRGHKSFLCLTYGTGIGGAIIEDKKIYHGSSYSAAEFGAIVTHADAKLSGDDYFDGCYERYGSTTALVASAAAKDPSLTNGYLIFNRSNEPMVNEIIDNWIDEILLGLSSLIHIFNPSCVILGGGVMEQPLIMSKIKERIDKFVMPSFLNLEIVQAELGNSAGMLGAYYLAEKYAESKNN